MGDNLGRQQRTYLESLVALLTSTLALLISQSSHIITVVAQEAVPGSRLAYTRVEGGQEMANQAQGGSRTVVETLPPLSRAEQGDAGFAGVRRGSEDTQGSRSNGAGVSTLESAALSPSASTSGSPQMSHSGSSAISEHDHEPAPFFTPIPSLTRDHRPANLYLPLTPVTDNVVIDVSSGDDAPNWPFSNPQIASNHLFSAKTPTVTSTPSVIHPAYSNLPTPPIVDAYSESRSDTPGYIRSDDAHDIILTVQPASPLPATSPLIPAFSSHYRPASTMVDPVAAPIPTKEYRRPSQLTEQSSSLHKTQSSLAKRLDSTTSWLILYFCFNLGLTLFNKLVLQGFPFPWALTGIQMLNGTIGTQLALKGGFFTQAKLTYREGAVMVSLSDIFLTRFFANVVDTRWHSQFCTPSTLPYLISVSI